ncbi:hypothetical protein V8E53_014021 [Lactarius tabidus]
MSLYIFWNNLYSIQQTKQDEVEEHIYQHCILLGLFRFGVAFADVCNTGWHGESGLRQSGRHLTVRFYKADWKGKLEWGEWEKIILPYHMAAADARYNNAHRAHSFTTDTARVGGEPSSEILGSTAPHHSPRCVTIPTTATSIKAGLHILTTEGSEGKKWRWIQESQTMAAPI